MAFDVNGVFQRLYNWANDRDADINIRADRMDGEMDNLAAGLTRVISGQENFRGAIKVPNGVASAPALAFSGSTNTGFYRKPDGNVALAINGVEKAVFKSEGLDLLSALFLNGSQVISYADGVATVVPKMRTVASQHGYIDDDTVYGLDLRNSDLVGVNSMVLNDATGINEGIFFKQQDDDGYSLLRTDDDDDLSYAPAHGGAEYKIFHLGNILNAPFLRSDIGNARLRMGSHTATNFDGILYNEAANRFDFIADGAEDGSGNSSAIIRAGRLRLDATTDASETSTSHALQIGADDGANLVFDNNEIIARNNGEASNLVVNSPIWLGDDAGPTLGVHVGNRAYNDARYAAATATASALNGKFDKTGGTVTGNLNVQSVGNYIVSMRSTDSASKAYVIWEDEAGGNLALLGGVTDDKIGFTTFGGRYVDYNIPPRVNGVPMAMQKSYDSGEVSWSASAVNTFAHGLGEVPKVIDARLKMTTAVQGFANNSEVQISKDRSGAVVWADATNVYVRSNNANGIYGTRGTGSADYINTSEANMVIRAFA